ncbi:MAG: signal peptidase II [Bacilli bacterium]|nr:signal peptidase II [Bacilli bacterium]
MKKLSIYTIILILLDQISKILISNILILNEEINIIKNFFNITYVKNIGAAFSIFEGKQIFLVITSILILIIIYYFLINKKDLKKLEIISYSLIISGIIGNLIDRIIYQSVIDFLSFKLINYYFPIFNLADTFIVIGSIIYIIIILKEEQHGKNNIQ